MIWHFIWHTIYLDSHNKICIIAAFLFNSFHNTVTIVSWKLNFELFDMHVFTWYQCKIDFASLFNILFGRPDFFLIHDALLSYWLNYKYCHNSILKCMLMFVPGGVIVVSCLIYVHWRKKWNNIVSLFNVL